MWTELIIHKFLDHLGILLDHHGIFPLLYFSRASTFYIEILPAYNLYFLRLNIRKRSTLSGSTSLQLHLV